MHWNTFLAISSDTTSKSSAKSGLSSALSNNNSSGKRAGCCCRQEGECTEALHRDCSAPSRQGQRLGCASTLSQLPELPARPDPHHARCPSCPLHPCALSQWRLPLYQALGDREGAVTEAQHRTGGAEPHITAGPSSGPGSSACLQVTAPAESSLIYTQIIYSKSAFLTHAFILLYCNVST